MLRVSFYSINIYLFLYYNLILTDHSINSLNGLVTMLTQWMGLMRVARFMVCFTLDMMRWVECMARLLRALSP